MASIRKRGNSCLCGILSDAMEGGYLDHNPA